MEEENKETIIVNAFDNPSHEEKKEETKVSNNQDNNKINIPAWDLTPPLDTIDRGQMN